MLVLGRRSGERILIGDDIAITIVSAGKDGVRMGIEAPREVRIHRAEIIDQVAAGNCAAVGNADAQTLKALLGIGRAA